MNRTHALLVALSFAVTAVFYRALPDPVPIHFDLAGNANGWMAKPMGALLLPLMTLTLAILLAAVHHRTPSRGLRVVSTATLALMTYVNILVDLVASGHQLDLSRALFLGLGVLLIVLGNFMGKLTRNPLVGIRTPWTLADDEVWLRTHRMGGPLSMASGALIVVEALVGAAPVLMLTTLLVSTLVPAAYSYIVHRSLYPLSK